MFDKSNRWGWHKAFQSPKKSVCWCGSFLSSCKALTTQTDDWSVTNTTRSILQTTPRPCRFTLVRRLSRRSSRVMCWVCASEGKKTKTFQKRLCMNKLFLTKGDRLESEYCFYLNTLKFCNVTKLLAYEIQTPFKRTKHGSLHISVTSVGNTRLFFSTCCCASFPSPPPLPSPFTLFTDYLTIRVLNKNEVRKWFEDYRSCRTCWTATKIFCGGGSNKKKKRSVHFKINLHSFASLVTKYVEWFHSFTPPLFPPPPSPQEKQWKLKCEWGRGCCNTNSPFPVKFFIGNLENWCQWAKSPLILYKNIHSNWTSTQAVRIGSCSVKSELVLNICQDLFCFPSACI